MSRGEALPRLTSLRLFAAGAVVVYHLDVWGVAALPGGVSLLGYLGVPFFFTLSGVVLTWGADRRVPVRRFYRRRFARVWPNHAVMAGVAALVPIVPAATGLVVAVPNLLLIQAWWPHDEQVIYGMNGVSWSLSCEAFFYACFPLILAVLRRVAPPWRWALAGSGLLLSLVAGILRPEVADHLPAVRLAEFLLGVVAGLALREGWVPRIPVLAALGAVTLGLMLSYRLPYPLPNTVMALPFVVALLCAAGRDLRGEPGWLPSRWLIFAGEASFALYLVHELTILNLREVVPFEPWVNASVLVVVACVAAVALHLLVERPANKRLRGGAPSVALASPSELALPQVHDDPAQPDCGTSPASPGDPERG
jgi:peptidoglycan/LPS O-acetylase OafA/YrhL